MLRECKSTNVTSIVSRRAELGGQSEDLVKPAIGTLINSTIPARLVRSLKIEATFAI
jgi:hypothetical protein